MLSVPNIGCYPWALEDPASRGVDGLLSAEPSEAAVLSVGDGAAMVPGPRAQKMSGFAAVQCIQQDIAKLRLTKHIKTSESTPFHCLPVQADVYPESFSVKLPGWTQSQRFDPSVSLPR